MAITSVGDCENINSIDTIQLNATQDWKECTRILKTKKAYFLNISVGAVGYGQRKGKIWISDLEVLGDGKAIGDNPQQEYKKEDIHLKATDLIHWNNKEYDNLPFLNKKILGLGETAHGTETMNDIGIEISKERILKHQCRFILLEIPLEFSLYINRYVQNDKILNLNIFQNVLNHTCFPTPSYPLSGGLKNIIRRIIKKSLFWDLI